VEVGDPGRVVELREGETFVDFRSIVKPGLVGCLGFRRPSEETVDLYSFLAD
jgi:hypothetical protein